MGRISRLATISRTEQYVATAIERTNALIGSLQKLRDPFREAAVRQLATFSSDEQDLNALQQQESLEGMVAQLQTISPAVGALIKEETLLNLYRGRLAEWHSGIQIEYHAAWSALILRLCALAAAIAVLVGARRVMSRHAKDYESRQALLIGQRVLFWVVLIAVVLLAFAFDPTSLATFFGLLSAGLAVGLHDVLLAIGGRMLLERKFHIRIGERIEIAGVRGEVTSLGLMEFALTEIGAEGRATGREAHFANSYVFISPATPLFRQIAKPV
ncbi:MAG: mechanosensitive ion channel [Acetobacteraceae bacterium]|nr:mechanosensitive ion channel [Acetobacteraceae bacterium]